MKLLADKRIELEGVESIDPATVCRTLKKRNQAVAETTERRTNQDFARMMRRLVDEWFPEAEKIVLVMDNFSTPTAAALYEAFEPAEARRLVEKLEGHYTPKHGSWLNAAEMELSVLA